MPPRAPPELITICTPRTNEELHPAPKLKPGRTADGFARTNGQLRYSDPQIHRLQAQQIVHQLSARRPQNSRTNPDSEGIGDKRAPKRHPERRRDHRNIDVERDRRATGREPLPFAGLAERRFGDPAERRFAAPREHQCVDLDNSGQKESQRSRQPSFV